MADFDPTRPTPPGESAGDPVRSPWLPPAVAAAYLGVALGTLRNWTSMRYVPHAKRGRVVRYHRDELDRWLAAGARRGRSTRAN